MSTIGYFLKLVIKCNQLLAPFCSCRDIICWWITLAPCRNLFISPLISLKTASSGCGTAARCGWLELDLMTGFSSWSYLAEKLVEFCRSWSHSAVNSSSCLLTLSLSTLPSAVIFNELLLSPFSSNREVRLSLSSSTLDRIVSKLDRVTLPEIFFLVNS